MTDEKTTPEEDEVCDEQLDDVAGGFSATEALKPMQVGELQIFEDVTTFTGDGVISPPQVIARVPKE